MVTLGAGQRTDILVNATGKPTDSVFMRSDISETCTGGDQPYALAAIYYEEADPNATPKSQATSYDDSVCGNVSYGFHSGPLLVKYHVTNVFRILLT